MARPLAHTALDLLPARTVYYIGDRSQDLYWRWGSLPGRTRLLLLPTCLAVHLTEARIPAAGTFPLQPLLI